MIKTWLTKRNTFCNYPFSRFKVDCEGNCTFCCFQERRCLGNILEKSLEEIWFGEVAQAVRRETLNGKLHKTCAIDSCPYQHQAVLHKKEFYHRELPEQFEIDLPNTHCNIGGLKPTASTACIMCERARPKFSPQTDRLKEVCEKLRPYTKGINALHIQGVAEPFWQDRIFEIIDDIGAEEYKQHINISTTTNATTLGKRRMEKWLSYPNTSTMFSIDASTPETFKKIRRLDAYDVVIDTLMKYSRARGPNQFVLIHNNINMLNVHEVKGMVEVASAANVDEISFNPTYSLPGLVVSKSNVEHFKKAEEEIITTARRLNVKATFLRKLTLQFDEPLVSLQMPTM